MGACTGIPSFAGSGGLRDETSEYAAVVRRACEIAGGNRGLTFPR